MLTTTLSCFVRNGNLDSIAKATLAGKMLPSRSIDSMKNFLLTESEEQTSSAYSICNNNSEERNYCKVKLNIIETRLNYWSKLFIVVEVSKSSETLEDGKFSFLSNLLCFLRRETTKQLKLHIN